MGASSVTGKGHGSAHKSFKPTLVGLNAISNGPNVCIAGYAESGVSDGSSPATGNLIVFSQPLPGNSDNYVVLITTLNGGHGYVTDMDENENGDFVGFTFITEAECTIMYMITKVGKRIVYEHDHENCKRRDHCDDHRNDDHKYDRKSNDKKREKKNKKRR